ncbi:hypothetical protein [Nocardia vinacea]|uniref:hypothetical protein n=1 Tax=Nocardia vinacea TaxID=96468 RepID=UPI003F4D18E2
MRGNAIYQAFVRARTKVGVDVTFHDLRHTGQTLAASTGATLADLKKRLGHSSYCCGQPVHARGRRSRQRGRRSVEQAGCPGKCGRTASHDRREALTADSARGTRDNLKVVSELGFCA